MSQSEHQDPYGELAESSVVVVALAEIELARVHKAMDSFMQRRRPPAHIRPDLDLGFRVTGQSVEIFEIRPAWRGPTDKKHESPAAKATYVRSRRVWRVFWQRRDLKWHSYDPTPEVKSVEEFASLVGEDAHACFFG
jgi:Protein of unknown function (DUF3024)